MLPGVGKGCEHRKRPANRNTTPAEISCQSCPQAAGGGLAIYYPGQKAWHSVEPRKKGSMFSFAGLARFLTLDILSRAHRHDTYRSRTSHRFGLQLNDSDGQCSVFAPLLVVTRNGLVLLCAQAKAMLRLLSRLAMRSLRKDDACIGLTCMFAPDRTCSVEDPLFLA